MYNVRVKVLENASSYLDRDLGLSPESLIHFGLAAEARCFVLLSSLGDRIAVFNELTSQILKSLLDLETARVSAYLTAPAWSDRHAYESTKPKKTYVLVNLNIYGSSSIRDKVSKLLSLSHVYLQHPIYQHDDLSYDNPHFVEIHGISPEEDMLPDQSAAEVIDASQCGPLASSVQLRLDEAVSEAFDSLNRLKRLSQLEAPCCIRTPLLEYMIFQDPIASKNSNVHGKASKRRFRLHSSTRIWTCTRRIFVVAAVRTPGTRLVSLSIVFLTVRR